MGAVAGRPASPIFTWAFSNTIIRCKFSFFADDAITRQSKLGLRLGGASLLFHGLVADAPLCHQALCQRLVLGGLALTPPRYATVSREARRRAGQRAARRWPCSRISAPREAPVRAPSPNVTTPLTILAPRSRCFSPAGLRANHRY